MRWEQRVADVQAVLTDTLSVLRTSVARLHESSEALERVERRSAALLHDSDTLAAAARRWRRRQCRTRLAVLLCVAVMVLPALYWWCAS